MMPRSLTATSSRFRMLPRAPAWTKSSWWYPEMSPITLLFVAVALPLYPDKTKLLVWRDEKDREHAITKPADWPRRREHILAAMQVVMGPLPAAERKVPLDVQVSEETKTDKYIRRKITFAV